MVKFHIKVVNSLKIVTEAEVSWKEEDIALDCPSITPYLLAEPVQAPLVIVIPGGAYQHRAYHEGEPVAKWLNQNGLHACVLRYQVAPIEKQETIKQGQSAIQKTKSELVNWGLNPDTKVGVLGFSAGGHLAATISNQYIENSRPDFHILCYPVITMGEYTHEGSKGNLLGDHPSDTLVEQYSVELLVHEKTPPAFIWSTANDQSVNSLNSLHYAAALQQHEIPYELHIYQDGRHGLGLADEHPNTKDWKQAALRWLNSYIKESEER